MREGGLKIGEEDLVETPADADPASGEAPPGRFRAGSEDLPLFRANMDDQQLREIRGIAAELSELRDRLRKAIDGRWLLRVAPALGAGYTAPAPRLHARPMRPHGRSVAQPGSASVWGTEGRRFKSGHSDQFRLHGPIPPPGCTSTGNQ